MKAYNIVTNDEYELPIAVGLKTAREVKEFLGLGSVNTVRTRIHRQSRHHKYKIVAYDDGVKPDKALEQKRRDMQNDRSEYFRKRYLERKERKLNERSNNDE